jgi:predicted acylesterase/phospholipase RssA
VSAFTRALNTAVQIRSYTTDDGVVALSTSNCTIWEAARATSAAATFFDPIEIGRQRFVDGGTGMNNPVEIVLQEAVSVWPDAISRIQCLVSIGTGVPDLADFGDNLKEVVETLKAIATETEQTEQRFFRNQGNLGVGGRYFRFSVDKGLGGVGLDEHNKLDKIEAATELYLGDPRVKQNVQSFMVACPPHNCM